MICLDDLRRLDLFASIGDDKLQWICEHVALQTYQEGDIIVAQGQPPRGFFLHMEGDIDILRESEGHQMPIGKHTAPSFFGEVQIYTDEPVPITLKALTPCTLYVMGRDEFRQLMVSTRSVEKKIFQTILDRTRRLESFIRNREKMASLGTLAAGLAHELNNPASSLARILENLHPKILALQDMNLAYGKLNVDDHHTDQWLALRDKGFAFITQERLNSRDLAAREEDFLDWLEQEDIPEAWELAPPLAASGLGISEIQVLAQRWREDPTAMRYVGIQWLALSFDVLAMILDGQKASGRITELVDAVKSYSYVDRDVQQDVDVHQGIEDTLTMLHHKLKYGVTVNTHFDRSLPPIKAYGSELNQVWTNLLDNAIDAMNGQGIVDIYTHREGDNLCVDIVDNGPGIPEDIQSCVFGSFFTTKEVGKGTGLGLDITRRIVENRHRGAITLHSEPGKTLFTVRLPIA